MEAFKIWKKKFDAYSPDGPLSKWRYYSEISLEVVSDILPSDSFFFKNYFIETNEFYWGGAVKNEPNLRLVQFSDLHIKVISKRLKKAVSKVNSLNPELIFFTGDSINSNDFLPVLNNFLQLFNKDIQKVAILGNWEVYGSVDIERLQAVYAANNCLLLMNETQQFTFGNKTISITGVDDYSMERADYEKAVQHYRDSDYHIVLSHCPEHCDVISTQSGNVPVDFILSGHTHGGQVKLLGYVPMLPPGSGSYLSGWYNHIQPPLYVSKGLGTSVLPVRLGCTAEITVFHLKA